MTLLWVAVLYSAAPEKPFAAPPKSAPKATPRPKGFDPEAEIDRAFERQWANRPDAGEVPIFRWELKNVVDEVDMDGVLDSNGIPVKLHMVRVKGDLQAVLEDVLTSFNRQGLYVQPLLKQPQLTAETAVTGLDWSRFISYSAIIRPLKKSGVCEIILGEANIGLAAAMKQRQGSVPDFVPLPPSAKNVMRGRADELTTLSFSPGMSEDAVKKWYSDEMKKRGYSENPGGFEKGDEEIRMSIRKRDGEVVVMMLRLNRTP